MLNGSTQPIRSHSAADGAAMTARPARAHCSWMASPGPQLQQQERPQARVVHVLLDDVTWSSAPAAGTPAGSGRARAPGWHAGRRRRRPRSVRPAARRTRSSRSWRSRTCSRRWAAPAAAGSRRRQSPARWIGPGPPRLAQRGCLQILWICGMGCTVAGGRLRKKNNSGFVNTKLEQ